MSKNIFSACIATLIITSAFSQDSTSKLSITGSVDAYYRFNLNNAKDLKDDDGNHTFYNNTTSFTNSNNSLELGMASVKFDYTAGKAGVVADLGFGKRAEEFSYNETGGLTAIKQACVTYSPSDKIKFTLGKFGTHVGYEMLDPQLNRNYSMSYMFSYGPFFHTGLKADFFITNNFGMMIGISNPTDHLSASFNKKSLLAQMHGSVAEGRLMAYLNYVGGEDLNGIKSNQVDAVVTGKVSDKFSIGYNGTVKLAKLEGNSNSWWGSALYLNIDPTPRFGITVRGEYFDDKSGVAGLGTSFVAGTLSLNIKPAANLTILPEFRLDAGKDGSFYKNSGEMTKSTGSFILAAIVSF